MKTWHYCLIALTLALPAIAQEKSPNSPQPELRAGGKVEAFLNIPYADGTNAKQAIDLYLPKERSADKPLPVIVFIHGGAWISGDRKGYAPAASNLAATGKFAAASIGYRFSNEAKWPAQLHDCKAAIRWLRGNAAKYGLDTKRIGVTGGSAGGHLSLMVGLTPGNKELEGEVGEFTKESSDVTCVLNFCGPTDMSLPLMQGDAAKKDDPAVVGLVGGGLQEKSDVVKSASPINYVTKDALPIMTLHGTNDLRVNFEQAKLLHAALDKAGVKSFLVPVTDAGHGIPIGPELIKRSTLFWNNYLLGETAELTTEPIPPGK